MALTWQQPLPEIYTQLSDPELRLRIAAARETLGSRLAILGHHYQQDDVIDFAASEFANFQALFGHAAFANGVTTITSGADRLTLDGFASAAALIAGNTAGDFAFT